MRCVTIHFDAKGEGDGPIFVVTFVDGAQQWPYAYSPTDFYDYTVIEKIAEWVQEGAIRAEVDSLLKGGPKA